jgi:hypothetical protein
MTDVNRQAQPKMRPRPATARERFAVGMGHNSLRAVA